MAKYTIGLDYGTNSVRALVVNVATGAEAGTAVWNYAHGEHGVILSGDPNLARQHPADYVKGAEVTIRKAMAEAARNVRGFKAADVIGIGVDTTGSTPMPVDRDGRPLAFEKRFAKDPAAMAWLWKDHTGVAEAAEITALAGKMRPQYLAKCGGTYSSEWFFSKILHCLRTGREVFNAAHLWVEIADWIPAMLTGTQAPEDLTVGVCAAGHKAMYNDAWGGYPDAKFLGKLDPKMAQTPHPPQGQGPDDRQGRRRPDARVGQEDGPGRGHARGGGGVRCAPGRGRQRHRPGQPGQDHRHEHVRHDGGARGLETRGRSRPLRHRAGQHPAGVFRPGGRPGAVGDIFNWFVNYIQPGGKAGTHEALTAEAARIKPGASGLLALDWNNGNRTILVDQRLTGMLLGQTLYTTPAEVYRALIEATAFGALTIINRFEEYDVCVSQVINCGGIAEKNPVAMQIYADVIGRPMKVSRSSQTCALGAAIAGAVAAGPQPAATRRSRRRRGR